MLYLLDANMLIDASRDYYPVQRIPQFWQWLYEQALAEQIKLPEEIYSEVVEGRGDLVNWIKQREIRKTILFDEEPEMDLVNRVVNEGYAPDLT